MPIEMTINRVEPIECIPLVLAQFDPSQPVDYSTEKVPTTYVCGVCGATHCKLWKEFAFFSNDFTLLCAVCAAKELQMNVEEFVALQIAEKHNTKIPLRVPAIPTPENIAFLSTSHVTPEGRLWWLSLPSFPAI